MFGHLVAFLLGVTATLGGLVLVVNLLLLKKSRSLDRVVRNWQEGVDLLLAGAAPKAAGAQQQQQQQQQQRAAPSGDGGTAMVVVSADNPTSRSSLSHRYAGAFRNLAASVLKMCGPPCYAGVLWVRSCTDAQSWQKRHVRLYPGVLVVYACADASPAAEPVLGIAVLYRAELRQRPDVVRVSDMRRGRSTYAFELAGPLPHRPPVVQLASSRSPDDGVLSAHSLILCTSDEQLKTEWMVWLRSGILCAPRPLGLDAVPVDPQTLLACGRVTLADAMAREFMRRNPLTRPDDAEPDDADVFQDFSLGSDQDSDDDNDDNDDNDDDNNDTNHHDDDDDDTNARNDCSTADGDNANTGSASGSSHDEHRRSEDDEGGRGALEDSGEAASSGDASAHIYVQGVLDVRNALKTWNERWVELRGGVLITRRKASPSSGAQNVVLLAGCTVEQRPSKTAGYSFVVSHPERISIYSNKQLDGSSLPFAKLPGARHELILRTADEHERARWIAAIAQVCQTSPQAITNDSIRKLYHNAGRLQPRRGTALLSGSTTGSNPDLAASVSGGAPGSPNPRHSSALPDTASSSPALSRLSVLPDDSSSSSTSGGSGGGGMYSFGAKKGDDFVPVQGGDNDDLYWDGPVHVIDEYSKAWVPKFLVVKPGILIIFKNEKSTDCQAMVNLYNCTYRTFSPSSGRPVKPADQHWHQMLVDPKSAYAGVLIEHRDAQNIFLVLPSFSEKDKDAAPIDEELIAAAAASNTPLSAAAAAASSSSSSSSAANKKAKSSKKTGGRFIAPPKHLHGRFFFRIAAHELTEWSCLIDNALAIPAHEFPIQFPVVTTPPAAVPAAVESCEWANLFMNKLFAEMRANEQFLHVIRGKLQYRFNKIKKPGYVGPIAIETIDIGTELGQMSRVTFARPVEEHAFTDELIGQAYVEYAGGASVKVAFEVYVNWPRPKSLIIPVSAWLRVEHIAGEMRLFASREIPCRVSLAFVAMPQTVFGVRLVVGQGFRHVNLTSVFPRVRNFLQSTLRKLLWKSVVAPNQLRFSFPLPGTRMQLRQHKMTSKRSQARRQAEREAFATVSRASQQLAS